MAHHTGSVELDAIQSWVKVLLFGGSHGVRAASGQVAAVNKPTGCSTVGRYRAEGSLLRLEAVFLFAEDLPPRLFTTSEKARERGRGFWLQGYLRRLDLEIGSK